MVTNVEHVPNEAPNHVLGPPMTDALGGGWSLEQADIRRVFEGNLQPMWVTTSPGIVDVNEAALRHYDYSRDEFLAMSILDLGAAEGPLRGAVAPVLARAALVASGAGADFVIARHRKKDGSSIDVELTSFAISFGGKPAVLVSVVDVTYLRRTEAQTRYLDLLLATV